MRLERPIILCTAADADTLGELKSIVQLVEVEEAKDRLVFRLSESHAGSGAVALDYAKVYRDAIGFVAACGRAVDFHAHLSELWQASFGDSAEAPALLDLSGPAAPAPLVAVAATCWHKIIDLHARNVRLMRELGVLRVQHEATQASFQRLEAFFYDTNNSARVPHMTLSVHRSQRPLALAAGMEIEQRLPGDSGGLSDLSISVRSAPQSDGRLRVRVQLKESRTIVAEWVVPARLITPGWLRLTLEQALGPDRQTPLLLVSWDGDDPLLLNTSFHQPDPRFVPWVGSPMLALRTWKYVPGARATLPANGIVASSARAPDRWSVGRSMLRDAVALSAKPENVVYSDQFTGLFVMPTADVPGMARIDLAVRAGCIHVFGGIKTEDETGPVVEFAYGLAPSRLRGQGYQAAKCIDSALMSEWYPLPPNEWSELHLLLEHPVTEDHDLFLLTRLRPGETASEPPRACFFRITALADVGGAE